MCAAFPAHMRQHGKFEMFDAWNRDLPAFYDKNYLFLDFPKINNFA